MGLLCKPESVEELEKTIRLALSSNLKPYQLSAKNYVLHNLTKNKILAQFFSDIEPN